MKMKPESTTVPDFWLLFYIRLICFLSVFMFVEGVFLYSIYLSCPSKAQTGLLV